MQGNHGSKVPRKEDDYMRYVQPLVDKRVYMPSKRTFWTFVKGELITPYEIKIYGLGKYVKGVNFKKVTVSRKQIVFDHGCRYAR